jgi:hypothetical protein
MSEMADARVRSAGNRVGCSFRLDDAAVEAVLRGKQVVRSSLIASTFSDPDNFLHFQLKQDSLGSTRSQAGRHR